MTCYFSFTHDIKPCEIYRKNLNKTKELCKSAVSAELCSNSEKFFLYIPIKTGLEKKNRQVYRRQFAKLKNRTLELARNSRLNRV